MYRVNAQGIDEHMINIHYYYYYYLIVIFPQNNHRGFSILKYFEPHPFSRSAGHVGARTCQPHKENVPTIKCLYWVKKGRKWILMSCQPTQDHFRTIKLSHKQTHTQKLFFTYKPFLKPIHKSNPYTNIKHIQIYTNIKHTFLLSCPFNITLAKRVHKARLYCLIYQLKYNLYTAKECIKLGHVDI